MNRAELRDDLHRPAFHFLPPANWLNDPNGLIQWQGEMHMFYQYNPLGAWHERIHWGHAVSSDLVHWRDLPLALTPAADEHDGGGCFTGSAVNDGGVPTLIYTGVSPQVVNRAVSHDGLLTWQKDANNPVIASAPEPIAQQNGGDFRDPFVWREGAAWRMIIGTRVEAGGLILLYGSNDLRQWDYLGPFLAGDRDDGAHAWGGAMWECPNLLHFGDNSLLLFSPQNAAGDMLEPAWHVGRIAGNHFKSQTCGVLVYGESFYAPQVTTLADGRAIMWGWLKEQRTQDAAIAARWSGCMSAPIEIRLGDDGAPRLTPAAEVATLRQAPQHFANIEPAALPQLLDGAAGAALDIELEAELGNDGGFGILLQCSPDQAERTLLYVGGAEMQLHIERTHVGNEAVHHAPVSAPLRAGGRVKLRILVDHSTIEVFADEGATVLTTRTYPTRADSVHVGIVQCSGQPRIVNMDIWPMASIW